MARWREPERRSALALVPVLATAVFYLLPATVRAKFSVQLLPQLLAYGCLAVWSAANRDAFARLGLRAQAVGRALRWGLAVGMILGPLNTAVILWLVPLLGGDLDFLRETPHARLPVPLMLPWFILIIAAAVELNFRGFLLGRLLALLDRWEVPCAVPAAVVTSALVFAFDPFMVVTFRHLHWIAVWDGIIWGMMWVRLRSLAATIVAHAVEVIILYTVLKLVLAHP
ncbi:CPBP family glutamic-type intramembrane protease [Candidatus Nitrospira bockiana]